MPREWIDIGTLRWPVQIYQRDQVPDTNGAGIVEQLTLIATRHARIESSRPGTFYGSEQVETPVTHFIWMRWINYPPTTYVIVRQTNLPDGTTRKETFRVRRTKEIGGRKRFLELECELEKVE